MLRRILFSGVLAFAAMHAESLPILTPMSGPVQLFGNAAIEGNSIQLTGAGPDQAGSAWLAQPIDLTAGFEAIFGLEISNLGGSCPDWSNDPRCPTGGDGLAFVLRGPGSEPLGEDAAGLGYMGISNSIAIEFDTYVNTPAVYQSAPGQPFDPYCEPPEGHIAVQSNGALPNTAKHCGSATLATPYLLSGPLNANQIDLAEISYQPGLLEVYWQDFSAPILTVPVDLPSLLGVPNGRVLGGWTASTGGAWQTQGVMAPQGSPGVQATKEPSTIALLALGAALLGIRKCTPRLADRLRHFLKA